MGRARETRNDAKLRKKRESGRGTKSRRRKNLTINCSRMRGGAEGEMEKENPVGLYSHNGFP